MCAGSNSCIPKGWLCDGYTDCVHHDDESGCGEGGEEGEGGEGGEEGEGGEGSGGCPHESHACPSDPSVCVWWEQVCDGYADCPGLKF